MDELHREGANIAKAMAVEKYKAGDLAGAKEFAVRARTLNPELRGLLRLNAVLDLMIGFERKIEGEPDWYAVLSVEPTADAATIHNSYRRLFLDIADDGDDSVGSIDQAKKILVDSWKIICDEKRKKLYDERRRDQLRLRNLRRGGYEEQELIRRASEVPSLTYIPVVLPKAGQRRFEPPRRILVPENLSRRSQFPSLTYNLLAYSAPNTVAKSPRLFDPPRMVKREKEQKAKVKVEQMVQQRGGGSKRKAPPLTNVIHHLNQLRRISEDAEIRAIERRKLMKSQDVVRRALAEKAKSMIKQLDLSASRQADGGSDAAKKIPQDSKRVKRESKNNAQVYKIKEEKKD